MTSQFKARNVKTRGRERQGGFSLIELLIVVAIILIIAAIAIPGFLRSKMAANESASVHTLRTLTSANVTYASLCPSIGYTATLVDLGPGAGGCAGGANLVDNMLGTTTPQRSGYIFTYAVTAAGSLNTAYTIDAAPANVGTSGQRYFFTDESGVIRYGLTGLANLSSSPI